MVFTIKGTILDHNSLPISRVYVDAFHVNILLSSFLRLPLCLDAVNRVFLGIKTRALEKISRQYLGTAEPTDENGEFQLSFPEDTYYLVPNVILTIRNDHRILYETPKPRILNTRLFPSANEFSITIPQEKFTYSNEITHVDPMTLLRDIIGDTTKFSFNDFTSMWKALEEPLEDTKYLQKSYWEKINYNDDYGRGSLVPFIPKIDPHTHNVPWVEGQLLNADINKTSKFLTYDELPDMPKICGLEKIPKRALPYRIVTRDIVEDADVCVIGSGAAGAILASELAKYGKKVVLIEKGGYYEQEDFNQREATMMPLLWKNGGYNFTENGLVIAQGQCLGGSTIINDAVCFEPPKKVLEQWWDVMHSNEDPRNGRDDWVNKWGSSQLVGSPIHEVWNNKLQVKPVLEAQLKLNHKKLKKACVDMGYEWKINDRNSNPSDECGFCHLGCHYDAKRNVVLAYLSDVLHNDPKKIIIFCNCDVEKITYSGNQVTGVEGKFEQADGIEKFNLRVNAKVVILSAGSIASSALLINSNIARGKAGHGLALHPSTLLVAKFKEKIDASRGIPMAFSCTHFSVLGSQPTSERGYMIESIFTPIYQFALQMPQRIPDGNGGTKDPMDDFNYYAMAGIMLRDNPIGTITVNDSGRPRVHYNLSDPKFPMNSLTDGIDKLVRLWFEAGATMVISGYNQNENFGRDAIIYKETMDADIRRIQDGIRNHPHALKMGSAHPQGGNPMGKNDGVVDPNCKAHGFDNLFVCDASVFPLAVGVNPQITVMSLATIIAEHIKDRWNRDFEGIEVKNFLGLTGSKEQPMYCTPEHLETIFYQTKMDSNFDISKLVAPSATNNWDFDKESLVITNKNHWRGFVPEYRDYDFGEQDFGMNTLNVIKNFIVGFWKEFSDDNGTITGKTHIYQFPNDNHKFQFIATKQNYSIYNSSVIQLNYPSLLASIYDIVKVIDDDTIVGKAILGTPPYGIELFTFCMSRKYPAQFMDLDDHEKIFMTKSYDIPTNHLTKVISGRWAARDVKRNVLDRREIVNFKENMSKDEIIEQLKTITDVEIHTHLNNFEIRKVNDIFFVGKLCSGWFDTIRWGIPDYYIEEARINDALKRRICIRFVLTT